MKSTQWLHYQLKVVQVQVLDIVIIITVLKQETVLLVWAVTSAAVLLPGFGTGLAAVLRPFRTCFAVLVFLKTSNSGGMGAASLPYKVT